MSEALYFIAAPDSSNSSDSKGYYYVPINQEVIVLDSGSEYIYDGETLELQYNSDSIEEWPNGSNVVGIAIYLTFEEDETSNGLGCAVGGGTANDRIIGTIRHSLLDAQNRTVTESYYNHQGNNGIQIGEDWPLFLWGGSSIDIWSASEANSPIGNISKSEIIDAIDLGEDRFVCTSDCF